MKRSYKPYELRESLHREILTILNGLSSLLFDDGKADWNDKSFRAGRVMSKILNSDKIHSNYGYSCFQPLELFSIPRAYVTRILRITDFIEGDDRDMRIRNLVRDFISVPFNLIQANSETYRDSLMKAGYCSSELDKLRLFRQGSSNDVIFP